MELGNYKLIKSLGRGGMGEVFLAYDTLCERHVALKQIREDLLKYKTIHNRFLQEARIAAALTHPSIIPIFSIHEGEGLAYYTMPYIEGATLKEILTASLEEYNINSLMRIFLNICQAIAYCHSKRILHRDLKPENIIVGKFGEVFILDWGIAEYMENVDSEKEEGSYPSDLESHLTRPGKVVGTLSFLAPERAFGEAASEQSDLYALGVILYQLLTLKLPFKRTDLLSFQKLAKYEELIDPIEAAPYRDIPRKLADIAKKSLSPSKELRYQQVLDLVTDVETYIEGRPDWILTAELQIDTKSDWEFQENVLLAKHIAITRSTELMEWVSLMISKAPFSGNTKIEAMIRLGDFGGGVGILLNIPETTERKELMDGYCVWIGSHLHPGLKLFRSNIEVMDVPDVWLMANHWHQLRIEKWDNHLRFFIDDILKCHYISHTPLAGTHVGLLYRDADFELQHFQIFMGSQNVQVSCLAIPDAFLANKNYTKALAEYRRISHSFPGRTEEREALFRSGITLLEEGSSLKKPKQRAQFFGSALEEFGRLRNTAGAPLEYLGKSLVYKAMNDIEEEIKCLELALRKYGKHPLIARLSEHIAFRLHESSSHSRIAAYHFALLALRHLPHVFANPDNEKLLNSLKQNLEPLYFIEHESITVQLAFFLAKPITLFEMIESGKDIDSVLFALLELGCIKKPKGDLAITYMPFSKALRQIPKVSRRCQICFFQHALDKGKAREIIPFLTEEFDHFHVWALLYLKKWKEAGAILEKYSLETRTEETSPFYCLYGCYLWATEGEKIAMTHFLSPLETPYPPTTALLGYFLAGRIKKGWPSQAFFWEKVQLYRQLILFYHIIDAPDQRSFYERELHKLRRSVPKI